MALVCNSLRALRWVGINIFLTNGNECGKYEIGVRNAPDPSYA